jgi:ribosomal-protein-alanine N-acetyltransferase
MKKFPNLETKRLQLREFRLTDAQAVFEIFSQDAVTKYHNLETMTSAGQAVNLVRGRIGIFNHDVGIRWAIVMQNDLDIVIGSCGFYDLDKDHRSAEIGYDLHPAYWHQGIMTEALRAGINFGYSDRFYFHLNRIQALTYLDHKISGLLLLKLGFQEEGILRNYGYWKGEYHDLRVYSLIREDWENYTTNS